MSAWLLLLAGGWLLVRRPSRYRLGTGSLQLNWRFRRRPG